jgi:hypothetical protein
MILRADLADGRAAGRPRGIDESRVLIALLGQAEAVNL